MTLDLEGRRVEEGSTIIDAPVTLEEMRACLEVWDQTIGCNYCKTGWWAENATEDPTMFHTDTCPLKGNREAHLEMVNVDYCEKEIGRRLGTVFVQNRQMLIRDGVIEFCIQAREAVAKVSISAPTELTCIATFGEEEWKRILLEIEEKGSALRPGA